VNLQDVIDYLKATDFRTIIITGAMLYFFYNRLDSKIEKLDIKLTQAIDKVNEKIDKVSIRIDILSDRVSEIDKRLCRLEGAFSNNCHYMVRDHKQIQKAE